MSRRNGKAIEGHTATKSLHIKLPASHPIFQYPDGERSKVAREWMDRGRELSISLEEIKREIMIIGEKFMSNMAATEAIKPESIKNGSDRAKKPKVNPTLFLDL